MAAFPLCALISDGLSSVPTWGETDRREVERKRERVTDRQADRQKDMGWGGMYLVLFL